jgi:hypothetical protein
MSSQQQQPETQGLKQPQINSSQRYFGGVASSQGYSQSGFGNGSNAVMGLDFCTPVDQGVKEKTDIDRGLLLNCSCTLACLHVCIFAVDCKFEFVLRVIEIEMFLWNEYTID